MTGTARRLPLIDSPPAPQSLPEATEIAADQGVRALRAAVTGEVLRSEEALPRPRFGPAVRQAVLPWFMALREKRSVSLPPDLASAIDAAAAASGTSFSGWIADTAAHRLRLDEGRRGVAEWEAEHGPLSEKELAEGLARVRELLGRSVSKQSA